MSSDTDRAWALEEELLEPEVRRDKTRLDSLLAPGFREIGRSGALLQRADVIESLTSIQPSSLDDAEITDRAAEELDGGYVLLTYRLREGDRASWRSSLWQVTGYGTWLTFATGTPVPPS